MEVKEQLDLTFEETRENSCMGSMFNSLEEARKNKSAYECLKEITCLNSNFYYLQMS